MGTQMVLGPDGAMHIPPRMPLVDQYGRPLTKTYSFKQPLETHFRPASCVDADCSQHREGWASAFDESTSEGVEQANYVRMMSGRRFTEHRGVRVPAVDGGTVLTIVDAGPLTVFVFEAGQKCFQAHVAPLERDPLLLVRDGDWRGNPSGAVRVHANAEDWVDDFANHQDKLADAAAQG